MVPRNTVPSNDVRNDNDILFQYSTPCPNTMADEKPEEPYVPQSRTVIYCGGMSDQMHLCRDYDND